MLAAAGRGVEGPVSAARAWLPPAVPAAAGQRPADGRAEEAGVMAVAGGHLCAVRRAAGRYEEGEAA